MQLWMQVSGERFVPMSEEVEQCFRRIIKARPDPAVEPIIDGKIGFLFLDKNDKPMVALHWENTSSVFVKSTIVLTRFKCQK